MFRQASVAITLNPSLFLVGPLSTLFAMLVVAYWGVSSAYIATSARYHERIITPSGPLNPLVPSSETLLHGTMDEIGCKGFFLFWLFLGLLWSLGKILCCHADCLDLNKSRAIAFANGIQVMAVSGVVASWYWQPREYREYGNVFPLINSSYVACRYHLGTIALGMFISGASGPHLGLYFCIV